MNHGAYCRRISRKGQLALHEAKLTFFSPEGRSVPFIHSNVFSSSLHPWTAEKDSRSLYDLESFSPNTNDPQILLEFVSYHPLRAVGIIGAVAKDLLIL